MRPTTKPSDALLAERHAVAADRSRGGRALCRALSDATDTWLGSLLDDATGDTAGLAVVATGGYGRAELAPGSDIDAWLIHDGRADVSQVAERLWYPVWDSGLKLGHAVRTPKQVLALAAEDLDTATASLSLRFVAGDPSVVDGLAERALQQWQKRNGRWLGELADRIRLRHARHGEVAFLLEPDIKEGHGGLRDVHALRWAQLARPLLQEGDDEALTAAETVLLDVRVALHRVVDGPSDLLVLDRQDEVADVLGVADADVLMKEVSTAARTIAWIDDEAWHRTGSTVRGPRSWALRRDRPIGRNLLLRENEVHLALHADPALDPVLVLRAAAVAARAGSRIDRTSLDRLAAAAPHLGDPWPEGAREALVDLLGAGRAAIPILEALDQRRLLERVLPEWSAVRGLPQRNPLHRFTVDRHLNEAAANAADLAHEVARPDLLLLGTWLHDIGKGFPGDHTDAGVELIARLGPRMGLPPDDVDVLVAMCRLHLLLPDVATRRDLSDDDVISGVAEQVGDIETLELLAALTEADSIATGPAAWSPWKAELVNQLVTRVAHVLRGGDAAEVTGDGFPDDEVLQLMRSGASLVRLDESVLLVVAADRPGVFSRVAGTLALKGLTVLAADAFSDEGMAASRFRIDPGGVAIDWDEVASDITRAIDGRIAIEARLVARAARRRPRSGVLEVEPSVRFDNHASAMSTVVEVRCEDRVGALYRITRAFADLDLDIRTAKITTLGHEIFDAFYVRTSTGAKLTDREHLREVERAVLHQLSLS
ncbi:MAG TPA: [protein-PII] uridylyltransferase [Acidimicrobiales bacterium]|nr:[protein-PII] uridylyltransferase [Acidimicrobiales bacterium]